MSELYKRKKEPLLNKQLILDAAASIGAATDWHSVTFQAIADKTGLSKGGIMHHFRSKEELLDELMRQSLEELTQWIDKEMSSTGSDNASITYLRFIIEKSGDEKYKRTMKVVLQAVVSGQYRKMWEDWFQTHIKNRSGADSGIVSLITQLVADGLWFAEITGFPNISEQDKQLLLGKLRQL